MLWHLVLPVTCLTYGALAVLSDLGEPDRPFEVIEGDAKGKTCVDIDLLRAWHGG